MDVLVVGAGHNGLVTAAMLARSGHRVRVLERRDVIGGACVTEELIPGFRVSSAAYSFSLFRPEIVEALDLRGHGLRWYPKEPRMFVPSLSGSSFTVWRDRARTIEEIAAVHPPDADAYPRWDAFWDEVATEVRPLLLADPPSPAALEDALDRRGKADLYRMAIAGSAADTVRAFFSHEAVQGAFVGQGIIGTFSGPSDPGTAFVMTYHAFGGDLVDGPGTWAYVRGGMGSVTAALGRAAEAAGATIETGAEVERIVIEDGRARGVTLADGTVIDADLVCSNADPKRTFLALVPSGCLPDDFVECVRGLPTPGSVIKVNLALDGLPDFAPAGHPGAEPGPQHRGTIEISPSIDHLDRAHADAARGAPSSRRVMEVFIQSVTDDSLAPPGKHVASCFAQYAPASPGEAWPAMREAAGDAVVAELARYAPNVPGIILHREVLGPPDLEERFGLTGGNIFHGEITPPNVLGGRLGPRTPLAGLYLCGSGAHPGGGVSGAPGWNAAQAVIEDHR